MLKIAGSLLILSGGGLAWFLQYRERRRRRKILWDLITVLNRMGEEIRMARTPLPRLLERLAGDCGAEAAAVLQGAASAAAMGRDPARAWRLGLEELPLETRERELLEGLRFRGDEEDVRKGISLVTACLTERYQAFEHRAGEEDKRTAAVCLSGAALLVILLI